MHRHPKPRINTYLYSIFPLNQYNLLQVTTEAMLEHKKKLLEIPGSKLLFGGEPLENHSIPSIYGAMKPTAIYVPLEEILKEANYELVTKEIFGPFQVQPYKLSCKRLNSIPSIFAE